MRCAYKIWLIIAVLLMIMGTTLFVFAMIKCDWDFARLSTDNYVYTSHEVDDVFSNVRINVDTTDVAFVLTDGECRIDCYENDKNKHSVDVENGVLFIDTTDTRKWYEYVSVSFDTPKMTIYMPQKDYESLFVETDTGDVEIPEDINFDDIEIYGGTSDVDCSNSSFGSATIEVSTGDIALKSISCEKVKLVTSTGDIVMNDVLVEEHIKVSTSTGDVKFERCDADAISVKTSTGDVTGTLLSDKVFDVETSTGNVSVPSTYSGGECIITTSTGDIAIKIN